MVKCKKCGRNYTRPLINGKCQRCAIMDYKYSQGAITLDTYNRWAREWIPKRMRK